MRWTYHIGTAALATILFSGVIFPEDRATAYRAEFERQSDPVHRAKLMRKLGDAEFRDIEKEMSRENIPVALAGLQQYLDQAQLSEIGLDGRGVDAEKHPSGFKELQFSVRASLRRLDNLLVSLPSDEQMPFLDVRKNLDQINRHLIQELFPRQPASNAPSGKGTY